jgi:hypothetical protein
MNFTDSIVGLVPENMGSPLYGAYERLAVLLRDGGKIHRIYQTVARPRLTTF